jgi:hypothetical protein
MKLPERSKFLVTFASLVLIGSIVAPSRSQNPIKIIGSVVDPLSAPIPDAHITLYSLDRILQTTSDSSGHFHFDEVPPTRYEFEVLVPGFKRFAKPVDVIGGKSMELSSVMEIASTGSPMKIISVMEVAPTGTCGPPDSVLYNSRKTTETTGLSGIAIEQYGKRGISAATVQLFDPIGVQIAQQQTNENGEFQFKQIAPGRYHVVITHSGFDEMKSREFWVARDNVTRLTLRPVPTGKIMVCQ